MLVLSHALRLISREPRRVVTTAVGVGLAAALIVSILLFGIASGATVTARALASLNVDAQVELAPGADPSTVARTVHADPAVRSALRFELAHFVGAEASRSGSTQQTSSGVIVGYDTPYPDTTGLFKVSSGRAAAGAVTISRDLASNLGVVPGDAIRFRLVGGASVKLTVSGIVDIAGADLILGPVDAAHRAAGANAPTNVAVIDRATLDAAILPRIPPGAIAADPSAGQSTPATLTPAFAPEPAVRRELHLTFDHAQLPGDPAAAQQWLDNVRRRLERAGAGSFTVTDDASATLEPVAGDLAWGQVLFVFLALPGIAVAIALSQLAADATAEATRRHAALLRARGATSSQLYRLSLAITALGAVAGSGLGSAVGVVAALALFGTALAAANAWGSVILAVLAGVVGATVLAVAAAAVPLRDQLREEVSGARQELRRQQRPRWQRLNLDLAALLAAAVVYFVAGGSGVHPILTTEGNPTVTLALTAFLAPLLLWLGGTLFLLRLARALMLRGPRLAGLLRALLGPGGELAGHTLAARAEAAGRAITVLALAVSFVTSVLIFDGTYRQQQRVDAELTLGADLKATPSAPTGEAAASAANGPGVAASTPFVDRVVYVGSEAQDLLAVDAWTLPAAAPLADTFFDHLSASAAMDALRSHSDAILVSAETAKDYSLVAGDRVRIRVPDANGALRSVDFRMAGVALEFPTAPKDAFLVANLSYLRARSGNDRISWVLARSDGEPASAAQTLAARLGSGWQVTDIGHTTARLANSVTSIDLANLVLVDLAFGILIASVGVALFLLAGIAERWREIATLEAIGAEPGHIRASLAGETLVICTVGMVIGLGIGLLVGITLVQVLGGIFDPPPTSPVVPFPSLAAVGLAVILGLAGATLIADGKVASLRILSELRER